MQKINKIISIVLILSMLLSAFPVTVFAQEFSDTETAVQAEAEGPAEEPAAEEVWEEPAEGSAAAEEVWADPEPESVQEIEIIGEVYSSAGETADEVPADSGITEDQPEESAVITAEEPTAEGSETLSAEDTAADTASATGTAMETSENTVSEKIHISGMIPSISVSLEDPALCLTFENVFGGYDKVQNTYIFYFPANGKLTVSRTAVLDGAEAAAGWSMTGDELWQNSEHSLLLTLSNDTLMGRSGVTPEMIDTTPAVLLLTAETGGEKDLNELIFPECPAPAEAAPQSEAAAEAVQTEVTETAEPEAENPETSEELPVEPAEEPVDGTSAEQTEVSGTETVAAEETLSEASSDEEPASEEPAAEEQASEEPAAQAAEETEKGLSFAAAEILLHVGDSVVLSVSDAENSAWFIVVPTDQEFVRYDAETNTLTAAAEGVTYAYLSTVDPIEVVDSCKVSVVPDEVEIPALTAEPSAEAAETAEAEEITFPRFAAAEQYLLTGDSLTVEVENPEELAVFTGISSGSEIAEWNAEAGILTAKAEGDVTLFLSTVDPIEVKDLAVVHIVSELPEAAAEPETETDSAEEPSEVPADEAEMSFALLGNAPDSGNSLPEDFDPNVMAALSLDREYITLSVQTDDPVQLSIVNVPEDVWPYAEVVWTVQDINGNVQPNAAFTLSDDGVVTPMLPGTAYAAATVTVGDHEFTARCRVDVLPRVSSQITGVSLVSTKATTEIYRTDHTRIGIVLEFPQNLSADNAVFFGVYNSSPEEDNGASVKRAYFASEAVAALFDLRVVDDRTLEIIPTDAAIAGAAKLKSSYKSAIVVEGSDWKGTTGQLTLTVKKTKPSIKAKAVKFNSFNPEEAKTITFTGGTVTGVELNGAKTNPSWLILSGDQLVLTPAAKDTNKSGSVYLLVTVAGYREDMKIPVTVSVSAAKTALKLTFKPATLTLNPAAGDEASTTAAFSLAEYSDDPITVSSIKVGKTVYTKGDLLCDIDGHTVTFSTAAGFDNSKAMTFTVTFAVAGVNVGTVTVKTLSAKTVPSVTLKAAGTINPAVDGSPVTLTVTPKNYKEADYTLSFTFYNTKTRKETPVSDTLFRVEETAGGYTVTKAPGADLPDGSYYVKISADVAGKSISAKVKFTVKTTAIAPVVTLKVSGSVDPVRSASAITVTPTIKNYYGHVLSAEDLVFYTLSGKKYTLITDAAEIPFIVTANEKNYTLTLKEDSGVTTAGKYAVGMQLGGTVRTKTPLSLPIRMAAAKMTVSPAKVQLLRNDRFDTGVFRITAGTTDLNPIDHVVLVANKTSAPFRLIDLGNGFYAIGHANETVSVAARTNIVKLSLKVFLKGNLTNTANATLTVTVSIVSTKTNGLIEYRRLLKAEIVPEEAGTVTFVDSNWLPVTSIPDNQNISLLVQPNEGYALDHVWYKAEGDAVYEELLFPYSLAVSGHDMLFRIEFSGGEPAGTLTIKSVTADQESVLTGEPVVWTAVVSGGEGALTYSWKIYNGSTQEDEESTSENFLSWTPKRVGTYTVQLTVTDGNGSSASLTGGSVTVTKRPETSADDFTYNVLDGTYCEITGYTGNETVLVLPETSPDGHIVQKIGDSAFENMTGLKSISIPETVITIGASAFSGCSGLMEIDIPETVITIGASAFYGCSGLTEIDIPETVTAIGAGAFSDCSGLTEIDLPKGLLSLGSIAFANCIGLTEIDLPDSIENIGIAAFQGCTGLTRFVGGSGLKEIGRNAFYGCSSLASVELSEGLIVIDNFAFWDCDAMESITLPDSITTLGKAIFNSCDRLTSVNYPAGLVSLTNNASPFTLCYELKTITIPEGVTTIPAYTFENMTSLKKIMIPQSVTSIGQNAFSGCTGLTEIYCIRDSWAWNSMIALGYEDKLIAWDGTYPSDPEETVTVSGMVTTAGSAPLSGVYVAVANTEDGEDYHTLWTDQRGQWTLDLVKGASYQIAYWLEGYTFSGSESFTGAEDLTVTAQGTLSGDFNDGISFSIKQNGAAVSEITVGTSVDFEVSAPADADMVRLVVDDAEYESYALDADHTVNFPHLFSSSGSGTRTIQFRIRVNYQWTDLSRPQYLSVRNNGRLTAPVLSDVSNHLKGTELDLSWAAVPNAQYYTVYVYASGVQVWPVGTRAPEYLTDPAYTVPASVFSYGGTYSIQVNALGTGYDSSTGYMDAVVLETDQKVSLVMRSGNTTPGIAEVCTFELVSTLDDPVFAVYLKDPAEENDVSVGLEEGQTVFSQSFDHAGTYELWAVVTDDGTTWSSERITLTVQPLTASDFSVTVYEKKSGSEEYSEKETLHSYGWEAEGSKLVFEATLNGDPYRVILTDTHDSGTEVYEMEHASSGKSRWTYELAALSYPNEKHTFTVAYVERNGDTADETALLLKTNSGSRAISLPIFCMSINPLQGEMRYNVESMPRYLPDFSGSTMASDNGQVIPAYSELTLLEGTYTVGTDTYMLVLWKERNLETFVKAGWDVLDSGFVSTFDGMTLIEQVEIPDHDENMPVGLNETLTYRITAESGAEAVIPTVEYIPSSEYREENPKLISYSSATNVPAQCTRSGETDIFTCSIRFVSTGIYYVSFLAEKDNAELSPVTMDPLVVAEKVSEEEQYRRYFIAGSRMQPIKKLPLLRKAETVTQVDFNTEVRILWDAGNDMVMIVFAASNGYLQYGYIERSKLSTGDNPSVIRGFSIIADCVMNTIWKPGTEKFESLISAMGGTYTERFTNTRKSQIVSYINRIAEQADDNDITYIYILAHGGAFDRQRVCNVAYDENGQYYYYTIENDLVQTISNMGYTIYQITNSEGNFENRVVVPEADIRWYFRLDTKSGIQNEKVFDEIVLYSELAAWVTEIPGQVILILGSCDAGGAVPVFEAMLDKSRFSAITGSGKNEDNYAFWRLWDENNGDILINAIYKNCLGLEMTKAELAGVLPEIFYTGMVKINGSLKKITVYTHPQYFGYDDTVMLYAPH